MRIAVYLLLLAIVTGLAHFGSVLALPYFTRGDVFSRLEAGAPVNTLALIDAKDLAAFPYADPAFTLAVCRYDLGDGPLRIRVPLSETFLAVVFAERHKGVYSSVSDRAATGGSLDVVVATESQLARIARLDEEDQAIEEIRVTAPSRQGMAILKVFVERPSSRERADALLREARCETESLPN